MPELPEVETTRRGLALAMLGRTVARVVLNRADLRFAFQPDFRRRIEREVVEAIDRRAKYLLLRLSSGDVLVAHLGMSGSFRVEAGGATAEPATLYREIPRLAAHDHVVFEMSDGARVVYNDPRRFGFMFVARGDELDRHPRLAGVGLEPLEPPLEAATLAGLFYGAQTSLKAALLDQKRIAGLGNIYVCEALHRAGLSPTRMAGTICGAGKFAREARGRLAKAVRDVLSDAIEAGGSSLRDFSGADGKPGYFQHSFRVYDREGAACPKRECHGTIERIVQSGRSTFFCRSCQR
ncbi:MAG: bifunctional DNA-formamidopyrimidine glycosylase/DNA-(apurinic or apyrimidinic site) lyase [Rhodoblastus sp.]